jgi:hypothetical protein
MSIPAPTYTYKGLTYQVEDDLYLGLKYNNLGSNSLNISVAASDSTDFSYGPYGQYGLTGKQHGNEGFSYQVGNNTPVFIPRSENIVLYYYYNVDLEDPRIGPTYYEIKIPADQLPDTGEVDVKIWSSDEDGKPRTRLTGVKLKLNSARTANIIESHFPITEDLIELNVNGAFQIPDLRRARKLTFIELYNVTNTEINLTGLTKLRKAEFLNLPNVTTVKLEDLDELIYFRVQQCPVLESANISSCFNLQVAFVVLNPLLTSVRCVDMHTRIGYVPNPGYYFGKLNITNNASLGAAALNQVYTDLADTSQPRSHSVSTPSWIATYGDLGSGLINVSGNLGSSSDDPSIATAKGWIVTGT